MTKHTIDAAYGTGGSPGGLLNSEQRFTPSGRPPRERESYDRAITKAIFSDDKRAA